MLNRRSRFSSFTLSLFAALGVAVTVAGCKKDQPPAPPPARPAPPVEAPKPIEPPACPKKFNQFTERSRPNSCLCVEGAATGMVWGTDIYTVDSSVCAAAVHAGAIAATGGVVTVVPAGGCPSYVATTRNGISAGSWGAYEGSFYLQGKGNGQCAVAAAAGDCPRNFKAVPNASTSTTLTCTCGAAQVGGSVWGTGVYTTDSSICRAAVHSGLIPPTGGKITVNGAAGCPKYVGSEQNTVKSSDWGTYDLSFFFPAKGPAKCP